MTALLERPKWEVKVHCPPFEPTTVKGDERRVCVVCESIMRDLHDAGRKVRLEYVLVTPNLVFYLEGVYRELRLSPPLGKGVRISRERGVKGVRW